MIISTSIAKAFNKNLISSFMDKNRNGSSFLNIMKRESPKPEAGPSPGKARPHASEGRGRPGARGRAQPVGQSRVASCTAAARKQVRTSP